MKNLIAAVIIAASVFTGSAADAQGRRGGGQQGYGNNSGQGQQQQGYGNNSGQWQHQQGRGYNSGRAVRPVQVTVINNGGYNNGYGNSWNRGRGRAAMHHYNRGRFARRVYARPQYVYSVPRRNW